MSTFFIIYDDYVMSDEELSGREGLHQDSTPKESQTLRQDQEETERMT
jgi:hypothetical protein